MLDPITRSFTARGIAFANASCAVTTCTVASALRAMPDLEVKSATPCDTSCSFGTVSCWASEMYRPEAQVEDVMAVDDVSQAGTENTRLIAVTLPSSARNAKNIHIGK